MDPGATAPGLPSPHPPSSSSSSGDLAPPAELPTPPPPQQQQQPPSTSSQHQPPSRYESQKRRDWGTFLQYLKNHKPPLTLARCGGAHVIEFLKYLDQFGKTKVHNLGCEHFGQANPPGAPCTCPLKQAWGSLDALIGRLRAAYEESGGKPESNPFGARAVRTYLREVKEGQAKARGIPYEKKRKRKRCSGTPAAAVAEISSSRSAATAAAATTKGEGEGEGSGAPPEGGDPTPSPTPTQAQTPASSAAS